MSAAPVQLRAVPRSRPVIEAPGLAVVTTPAPARGFFGTVALCIAIFIGALSLAFHLNTLMVQGAYDLKNIRVELNEAQAREATLANEVVAVSTPDQLERQAKKLGMAPATTLMHLDTETGKITELTDEGRFD